MENNPQFQVLLYYKYVPIANPEALQKEQEDLCKKLNLKGRIIVSKEGINGTLEGLTADTEKYVEEMVKNPLFQDVHFKRSVGTGSAFPKLSIKVRSEIVSAHLDGDDLNPNEITGKYLTAEELHEWFSSQKEFYIVDMRNDYEHKVGYFKDTIFAPFSNFRDLPKVLPALEHLKNKTILTVCTGGVRCEKASGFLVKHGFSDVYQLYGGIVTYMEKYPNEHFKGKLYVFDGRVVMGFNTDSPEHEIVSKCDKCGAVSDRYVDCAYKHCKGHRHFICCENCSEKDGKSYCSEECLQKSREKI
jgi:UPF0176 protein